ncbi:zinc finger X-chromosomal protein-like [Schistocerca piceifrons]|uniref:zinc finger X-chromosomal protein-like n=1 Tax=Schistocerca piceifrons TaxID=274613 RepID=UPI001F5EDDE3|nr:zinc finger X-chromosomal protein-like [Schistocerca piceifrons]XP_049959035.1 zinc finger X-chromosomal protein-like isoform X3 [Schistocerca serialis cubense]
MYCENLTSHDTIHHLEQLPFRSTELNILKSRQAFLHFQCCQCGNWYQHKGSLSRHLRLECGKEPLFSCSLCSYKSKQKHDVKRHFLKKHMKH